MARAQQSTRVITVQLPHVLSTYGGGYRVLNLRIRGPIPHILSTYGGGYRVLNPRIRGPIPHVLPTTVRTLHFQFNSVSSCTHAEVLFGCLNARLSVRCHGTTNQKHPNTTSPEL